MATLNIKGFPDDLYKILQDLAHDDRRSLAQEVIFLLQACLNESKKGSILDLRGLGKKKWKDTEVSKFINDERESWE